MTTSPAMRLRAPRWKDPRLIVGIVLVLVSILLGGLLAARLSQTTTVLVAREPIVAGDLLSAEDFTSAEVRLGDHAGRYLATPDQVPEGAVALRSVDAGELVPLGAIGQDASSALRPIMIPVDKAVAESVTPGRAVELWRTGKGEEKGTSRAELLVEEALVRRVEDGSTLGMRSKAVEVLVPRDSIAAVLEALGDGDAVDVIGVPGASEVPR